MLLSDLDFTNKKEELEMHLPQQTQTNSLKHAVTVREKNKAKKPEIEEPIRKKITTFGTSSRAPASPVKKSSIAKQ